MTGRPLAAVAAACAVVLTACAPPDRSEVGMRQHATDIRYGGTPSPEPIRTPAPKRDLTPAFPGFLAPPPVSRPRLPEPPPRPAVPSPVPCPVADPLAPTDLPAVPRITAPPREGVYTFRQAGTEQVDGVPQPLPAAVERVVHDVRADPGNEKVFAFRVSIDEGHSVTTTTYRVDVPGNRPETDGLFIDDIVKTYADGTTEQFLPATPLRILPLPVQPGANWHSVATDPLSSTSMAIEGTVAAEKARIDACGEPLAAWRVSVTGRIVGLDKSIEIQAVYDVATQYGGLILADHVVLSGTDREKEVAKDAKATINSPDPRPLPSPSPRP